MSAMRIVHMRQGSPCNIVQGDGVWRRALRTTGRCSIRSVVRYEGPPLHRTLRSHGYIHAHIVMVLSSSRTKESIVSGRTAASVDAAPPRFSSIAIFEKEARKTTFFDDGPQKCIAIEYSCIGLFGRATTLGIFVWFTQLYKTYTLMRIFLI